MPSAPVRPGRRKWQRWGRVVLLGSGLGLLQVLLLIGVLFVSDNWYTPIAGGMLLLYLLFPAWEGYLTVQQSESGKVRAALLTGVLVGVIGALPPIITLVVGDVLAPPAPPAPCYKVPLCGISSDPGLHLALAYVGIFFEGLGGLVGGLLGGLIGGSLAW